MTDRRTTTPTSPPPIICRADRARSCSRELMSQATESLATTRSTRPGSRPASRRPTRSGSGDRGRPPACRSSPSSSRLNGAIISAVDLVRGVGVLAGWDRIDVPGATGYLDTDYAAKGRSASRRSRITTSSASTSRPPTRPATKGGTTPRSRPSSGSTATSSARSARALAAYDQWRILISPDHSTLLRTRAHDRAPVAWAMAGTGLAGVGLVLRRSWPPKTRAGPYFDQGYQLMDRFLDLSWDGRG